MTDGLVRIGGTIRRPPHPRSAYVQQVLLHLEAVGFDGAPRYLGVDERGREVLTFIEGEVPDGAPAVMSDRRLRSAAELIRAFHDATAGTAIAGDGEVVCHGDLGHHNTVFRDDQAIGLIDWDDGVAPGTRLVDFAHAVWCFAGAGELDLPIPSQARAVKAMCGAYGWGDPGIVVAEIADRLRRARDEHARHGRLGAVIEFERMTAAMNVVEPELRRLLT